jgi:hypothetical protein
MIELRVTSIGCRRGRSTSISESSANLTDNGDADSDIRLAVKGSKREPRKRRSFRPVNSNNSDAVGSSANLRAARLRVARRASTILKIFGVVLCSAIRHVRLATLFSSAFPRTSISSATNISASSAPEVTNVGKGIFPSRRLPLISVKWSSPASQTAVTADAMFKMLIRARLRKEANRIINATDSSPTPPVTTMRAWNPP